MVTMYTDLTKSLLYVFGVNTLNNKQDTEYKTVQLKGKNAKLQQFHMCYVLFLSGKQGRNSFR